MSKKGISYQIGFHTLFLFNSGFSWLLNFMNQNLNELVVNNIR